MIAKNSMLPVAAALGLLPLEALAQAQQQPVMWERMTRMQLEAEYAGPLKDTTIQRWRDPVGDVICYVYLPFTAQHSPPTASGYVQYGANTIGSISCLPVLRPPPAAAAAKPSPPKSSAASAAKPAPARATQTEGTHQP